MPVPRGPYYIYELEPLAMLWSHASMRSTGCMRVIYDVLTKGSQEPVRLPYGACTGQYGACACTVRTRACTVRVCEYPYDHSQITVRILRCYRFLTNGVMLRLSDGLLRLSDGC